MAKVLIVDDNEQNLYLLQALLAGNGYEVVSATNGAEALDAARGDRPDLVIADILMPVMDGFTLCREWKRDDELRRVPFVFYTATYTDRNDQELAQSLGAERFIVKPQEPDVFMEMVEQALAEHQTGQLVPRPGADHDERIYFKQYNQVLVHKLEDKMLELEEANRALEREVSQHKQAQERSERLAAGLRESELRYRRLVEHIPAVTYLADLDEASTTRYISPQIEQLTGFTTEGYALDPDLWRKRIHPEDRDRVLGEVTRCHASGEKFVSEYRLIARDGESVWVHDEAVPVPGDETHPPFLQGIMFDITERKQLEEQLHQAAKMETVGRLAGGVAHDFNNILTGIKGYARFLLEAAAEGSAMHNDLTEIDRLSDRASELTRQLLAFSRKQTLRPEVLDLNVLIANAMKVLMRLIGEHVELKFAPAPSLGRIQADAGQIEQVLMNLAVNARDAMPEGGKITIDTANVYLDRNYASAHVGVTPGQYVLLAVSDTGCGMDRETREHIFEPFFTTREVGEGTGLGLATVYGIAKQHGGNIWVYSEPGKGTTFKIYLPRTDADTEEVAEAEETDLPRGAETILLAEDEESVRVVAERALRELGYTVISAADAEEAERLIAERDQQIDLLLTDVVMPGRSGRALYEQLALDQPSLKVLYVSGYTDDAIVQHGVLTTGTAFLQKPFSPASLARKVREVLDG